MSAVLNMVGGGDPDKSGIILNNSQVKAKVPYEFVSIGAAALDASPFKGVSLSGLANSIQYSYIRLGPVDMTNVSSINSVISVWRATDNGSTLTTRAVLFASQESDDRSYNNTATAAVVSKNARQTETAVQLDTSGLSGLYYVYAGTDTNGTSLKDKRNATVFGVRLNKGGN